MPLYRYSWTPTNDGTGSGLDADLLDGLNTSSTDTTGNSVVTRSGGGFSAGTIVANLSGTASTATNVAGGAANKLVYQTAASTTNFVDAPTVTDTYLKWNGSAYTWSAVAAGSSWQRKTANYTAVAGDKIVADTTGGTFTITLPATPTTGASVVIADGGDWQTTNLTVGRNGSTIEGAAENLTLDIKNIQVELVYDGTTWEVYAATGPSVSVGDDNSTDTSEYPLMARVTTGLATQTYVSSTKLYFNPSSGTLNSTSFNSLSDNKYKTNVATLSTGLDVVNQIRPVSFNWIDTDRKAYGVIAQEIEQVLPEIVETAEGKKTVAYDQIIPFLVKSIQELQQQVADLKEIINGNIK